VIGIQQFVEIHAAQPKVPLEHLIRQAGYLCKHSPSVRPSTGGQVHHLDHRPPVFLPIPAPLNGLEALMTFSVVSNRWKRV
jgi:hypothetical protein